MDPYTPPPQGPSGWSSPGAMGPTPAGFPAAAPPPKKSHTGLIVAGILGCLGVPLLGGCLLFGFGMFLAYKHQRQVPPPDIYAGPSANAPVPAPMPLPTAADPLGQGAGAPDDVRMPIPVTAAQPSRGPTDAPVTIVEFADFQCPFCGRATSTMHALDDAYPGKIRFVWRNEPLSFHIHAEPAAEAAMEAFAEGGSAKFWQMHDRLYADQQHLDESDLVQDAVAIGLDAHRFRRALHNRAHAAEITSDQAMGRIVGANGTPTFFVNGRKIAGAQPLGAFRRIVDEELAHPGGATL